MLEEGYEALDEDRGIQTCFGREPSQAVRKLLSPHLDNALEFAVLIHLCEQCLELVFKQGAFFFDDVACVNLLCEFTHDVSVKRMRHPEFENGDVAVQVQFAEGVQQVTVSEARGNKPERRTLLIVNVSVNGIVNPIQIQGTRGFQCSREPFLQRLAFNARRIRRQDDAFGGID